MSTNNTNPFKRANALTAAISEILRTSMMKGSELMQAIQLVASRKEFQPRGHGGKHHPRAAFGFVMAIHRRMGKSKYQPHQGKREVERRLRQMERNANNLEARAEGQGFGLIAGGAA